MRIERLGGKPMSQQGRRATATRPGRVREGTRIRDGVAIVCAALFAVLLAVAPSAAFAANQSGSCTAPTAKVADGFAGAIYVMLRVQQVDADHTWICFRAQDGTSPYLGGKVVVSAPSATADPPTSDSNASSCQAELGNQVPGLHPQLSGEIGDPQEPPYAPYLVDTFANASEVWFCLRVGDFQTRVIAPAPSAQAPDVQFLPDSPVLAPPEPPTSPGSASATCQNGVGGSHDEALNAELADNLHVWLGAWRPSLTQAHLCVRVQGTLPAVGPIGLGGALSFDASSSPGVTPVLSLGDNLAPCSTNVLSNDQASLEIKRSATGANPASLCVRQGTTSRSLTVGATGTPTPPTAIWTPDEGTPGPLP